MKRKFFKKTYKATVNLINKEEPTGKNLTRNKVNLYKSKNDSI